MSRTPLLLAATALALLSAAPAAAETVAVVNARIETGGPAGAIPRGTVVMTDGRITAVGADARAPAGARVIDAAGKVVTPGLVAALTNLTVAEVEGLRETRDDQAGSGSGLSAGFDVSYGVNMDSTMIPLARSTGITRAVLSPGANRAREGHADDGYTEEFTAGGGEPAHRDAGLFGGQMAAVRLADGDPGAVFARRIGMESELGRGGAASSRGTAFVLLRSALDEARRYARNRAVYDRGAEIPSRYTREDLEALIPVAEGRIPLLVDVDRKADILQVLRFAEEQHVKLVLSGVAEGWTVAAEIARARVPVIVNPEQDLPDSFDTLASRLDNAARLHAAGVQVAIVGSYDFNNLRQARLNAGTAVSYGLPHDAAVAALTSVPAAIWGFGDRAGSLQVGREADLVIWNGDPLETSSWPEAVFVAGREQPNTSRGLQLRDRYLPQTRGAAAPSR